MWCHLPTGFKRHLTLLTTVLSLLFIALFTTLIFSHVSRAAEGTNKTLSFQGRLLRANGAVVPDGHYNIQFKLYQDGSGTLANNSDGEVGTLKWTEEYINNNGTSGIQVKNGLFSVELGSKTPFASLVDWNQDTLWLSMNIAGSATDCTAFGSGTCTADGEMLPMKRLTSTPYAMNAGALNGKTAANFIQLAQGVQEDASDNTSSIYLNKTGLGGNLIQLQSSGEDIFRVDSTGDVEFGSATNHDIRVATSAEDTVGRDLGVIAGHGGDGAGSDGGNLLFQGGGAGGTNGNGGTVSIDAGASTGTGIGGNVEIGTTNAANIVIGTTYQNTTQNIIIGANETAGSETNTTIGNGAGAASGTTKIQSKDSTTIATNGVDRATFDNSGNLTLGNGTSSNTPADFKIQGTASSANGVNGSTITIQGGNATAGNANGGNLHLSGGTGSGSGSKGLVVIDTPAYASATTQSSAISTSITQANIDSFGVVTLNATAANVGFTLGAPSLGANAAGRVIYVTAANGSQDLTLRANVGGGTGVEQNVSLRQNNTATMLWNGSLWTVAGSSPGTLQSAYDNTPQSAGKTEIVVGNNTASDGLTIKESSTAPLQDTLLEVKNSSNSTLFSVNSNINEFARNGGAETAGSTATSFPAGTWESTNSATITRQATAGNFIANGQGAVKVVTSGSYQGAFNRFTTTLTPSKTYNVSASIRLASGSAMSDFGASFSVNSSTSQDCVLNMTVTSTEWKRITCSIQTPASGLTSDNGITIGHSGGTARTFYIDDLSVTLADSTNLATDGTVADGANFSTNWTASGAGSTVTHNTSDGHGGTNSAQAVVTTGGTQRGVRNKLSSDLQTDKRYRVSTFVKQTSGSAFDDFTIRYSSDGGTNFTDCIDYNTRSVPNAWTEVSCYINTGSTAPAGGSSYMYFVANTAANRTFLVDTLTVSPAGNTTASVQIGNKTGAGDTTLFTLDKATTAPTGTNNDALLGSMYYDTTLGKVQCYESDGWGSCGAAPDTFITLSPEYASSVINGGASALLTTDFCSDDLNINDGTSSQPSICANNNHETYNYYRMTSQYSVSQTKTIYVNYRLPTGFKKFAPSATSLTARSTVSGGSVTYQIYRNTSGGIVNCGSAVTASTGAQSTWLKTAATGDADPSGCGFVAGDSIVFKITLVSGSGTGEVYASDLNFAYSNN